MSAWISHVKAYQSQHGCSYKDALKGASSSYRSMKGSGPFTKPRSDTGPMYAKGGNLKKTSKAQLKRIVEALGDKAIGKLSGMGSVGQMLKESAANNTVRLMDSGTNRATGEMETRGTGMRKMFPGFYGHDLLAATRGRGVNRLKKADRWEQFSNAALRDAIDTAGKAGRVYYDTTNPMAQMGFGLKKHRKLKGKALMAAGY